MGGRIVFGLILAPGMRAMSIFSRLLLPYLIVMSVLFALVGITISMLSVRYVGEFELPAGSLLTFKAAEAMLKSQAALDAFTQARGIAETAEAKAFAAQLEKGNAGP